jgi:hypothetical protein
MALFQIATEDELVVDATGGRTSYKNAGKTLRQGVEPASTPPGATSAAASRCPPARHLRRGFPHGNANTLVPPAT